ncbi:MAG: NADH-quinone oxidoreductase subunit L [Thermonemataceae bacterium]|nr:NADH-quinone oxidoreductase subunit L [Thermonemataceae bacterium]
MLFLLLLLLLIPLASFFILFLNQKNKRLGFIGGLLSFGAILSLSFYLFFSLESKGFFFDTSWVQFSRLRFGFQVHFFESLMGILVILIATLVHIFSGLYMREERNYTRYFAYLQLFVFAMLALLFSSNLLQTYVFWEVVGFSSYLLIGFWQERPEALLASRKAFLVNRVGDVGFLIAILLVLANFETLTFSELELLSPKMDNSLLLLIGLGIFLGAMAKSAQFPLHIWLPNAMEGPTPASALIHAATMVAAGVFLVAKMSFIFVMEVKYVVILIGSISMLLGAYKAVFQRDIKKVLAYSTISQLGLMMLGLGIGATQESLLHLFTHAFFKAGLFLSVGAIIYTLHHLQDHYHLDFDAQDMHKMGGLRKKMPLVFLVYTFNMLALAGFPFFSGFLSKDAILLKTFAWASVETIGVGWLVLIVLVFSSFLTAFYMAKQWYLVFFGEFRGGNKQHNYDFEPIAWQFSIPLLFFAIASLAFLFSLNPFAAEKSWLWNYLPASTEIKIHLSHIFPISVVILAALAGLFLGFWKKTATWISNFLALSYIFRFKIVLYRLLRGLTQTQKHPQTSISSEKNLALIQPIVWLADLSTKVDVYIDTIINFLPKLKVVLAHILAWIDRKILDNFIHLFLWIGRSLGNFLRSTQGSYIQAYFSFVLILFLIFIFWLLKIA